MAQTLLERVKAGRNARPPQNPQNVYEHEMHEDNEVIPGCIAWRHACSNPNLGPCPRHRAGKPCLIGEGNADGRAG